MRDWARTDASVERAVRSVDERRIRLLQKIFVAIGYAKPEAFIRARIAYFHQVGYYALRIAETRRKRRGLLPLYLAALTGRAHEINRVV